jgi:phosphoglycerate dehydrogenase-like enzyme
MDAPDIAVTCRKIHGQSAERYAELLRERLPDREVAFARTPAEERELVCRAPVVTGNAIDADLLDDAEQLRLFACAYAGTGHLPLDALEAHGVAVTNAAGVHGPNIAEQVIGSMLAFARGFDVAWRRQQRREWRSFHTSEVEGSTVVVVGLGAIGAAVVERLEPFGVRTVGVRYTPEKGGPTDEVYGFDGILDALVGADYVVVACPLSETTRGLIDDEAFETMPPEAVLVNVGRGPIVDTDALVAALRRNAIRGAALDVTDPEPLPPEHVLWTFDNVLITPHSAGGTPKYFDRLADIVARNVRRLEETGSVEELENRVR